MIFFCQCKLVRDQYVEPKYVTIGITIHHIACVEAIVVLSKLY
jgi:hypothetical protein